jgi:hypothetical protein
MTILMIMSGLSIITPFIANISQTLISNIKKSKCCGGEIEMRDKPIEVKKDETPKQIKTFTYDDIIKK